MHMMRKVAVTLLMVHIVLGKLLGTYGKVRLKRVFGETESLKTYTDASATFSSDQFA